MARGLAGEEGKIPLFVDLGGAEMRARNNGLKIPFKFVLTL
jgi:hypothetical protein